MPDDPQKPKSRRGGARPGAGRKPKPKSPTAVHGIDLAAALAGDVPEEIDRLASGATGRSVTVLVNILIVGASESAQIDAANEILDRGYGKPTVEAGGDPMLPFLGRAPVRTVANETREEARRYARLAIATLEKIQDNGRSEATRVRAAKSLLARALGSVAPARVPAQLAALARPVGKKEAAAQGAKAAGVGRFATPPAPARTVQ